MSHYYLDASALVKRYVDEAGSDWVRSLVDPAQSALLYISRLAIVEVISAFARRVRDGSLSREEFAAARDAFRGDCVHQYQVMPATLTIVDLACALLERRALRALDATHVATALTAQRFLDAQGYSPLTFVSGDDRLNHGAAVEGLTAMNPNQHH